MKKRLCMALVLTAAAALASCGGGSSGASSSILPVSGGASPKPAASATPTATASPTPAPSPTSSASPTPSPTFSPTLTAPSIVQWNSDTPFAQGTINVSMQAPPAIGDVLLVAFWNNGQSDGSPNTYTAPAGWTQVDVNPNYYATYQAFEHVVTASDTNAYVFTPLAAVRQTVWIAADITGASATAPIDGSGNNYNDGTSPIFATPVLTPSHTAELALTFNMPIPTTPVSWSNPPDWSLGIGPTYIWSGESFYQSQISTAPVSESSTLSATATGFSALVLVNPAGV